MYLVVSGTLSDFLFYFYGYSVTRILRGPLSELVLLLFFFSHNT